MPENTVSGGAHGTTPLLLFADIARNARLGDYGQASSLLNRSIPLLQDELFRGRLSVDQQKQVARHLADVLAAQQRGDWVALADLFEYSLAELWKKKVSG